MLAAGDLILPDWPAPPRVRALVTTRAGGVSASPFDRLNLGLHVGDAPAAVTENRRRLQALLGDAVRCQWLNQVHGTRVVEAAGEGAPAADAAVSGEANRACLVMTADCLPVLFASLDGDRVGAAHAGWRGLADGVLESTLAAMAVPAGRLIAWLGPAIGPGAFEVGGEVRARFLADDPGAEAAFVPGAAPGKWLADLYVLARRRLARAGVADVYGGGCCTFSDRARFFSYRRDGRTGRMASLVWLSDA